MYLEDAGYDWKVLGPDVSDVDYVAWQADQDAYACSGQKCSAQSLMLMHTNWRKVRGGKGARARGGGGSASWVKVDRVLSMLPCQRGKLSGAWLWTAAVSAVIGSALNHRQGVCVKALLLLLQRE